MMLLLKIKLKKTVSLWSFMLLMVLIGCKDSSQLKVVDNFDFAKIHQQDLQLSVYITAHTVERLLSLESGRREAVSLMRANGITKVYIEVYRSGLVVSTDLLKMTSNYFKQNGILPTNLHKVALDIYRWVRFLLTHKFCQLK